MYTVDDADYVEFNENNCSYDINKNSTKIVC